MSKNVNTSDQVWKSEAVDKQYLEGVRRAMPLAGEQIDLMLFILQRELGTLRSFLDLGCGDGILGRALFDRWPEARGVLLDFSETMMAAAKNKMASTNYQAIYIVQDYGRPEWVKAVASHATFDVIVSGLSIHHQPNQRKKELYRELFDLLAPGGWFLNLEHVASASRRIEAIFDEFFIESLWRYYQKAGTAKTPDDVALEYHRRPDKAANILALVEEQCQWLRDIGFEHVDCYFKLLEIALFGGKKPGRAD